MYNGGGNEGSSWAHDAYNTASSSSRSVPVGQPRQNVSDWSHSPAPNMSSLISSSWDAAALGVGGRAGSHPSLHHHSAYAQQSFSPADHQSLAASLGQLPDAHTSMAYLSSSGMAGGALSSYGSGYLSAGTAGPLAAAAAAPGAAVAAAALMGLPGMAPAHARAAAAAAAAAASPAQHGANSLASPPPDVSYSVEDLLRFMGSVPPAEEVARVVAPALQHFDSSALAALMKELGRQVGGCWPMRRGRATAQAACHASTLSANRHDCGCWS